MLGRRARGLVREKAEGEALSKDIEVAEPPEPVDLNPIAIAIHHGCMGLPQEIVDYIMDMLHDNIQALKACSLTCKAMFASTRHLVHQTLHLTTENIASRLLLDKEEKSRYRMRDFLAANLQFLSQMGERGLLQYTRQVHISLYCTLTPEILQPQLHYFQSLDRVHALTLAHTDTSQYHHQECFTHFYPTLTSLTLRFPLGDYRDILRFASQFPKLENLCLDSNGIRSGLNSTIPVITDRYPPLCGRLRLVGNHTVAQWPVDFVNELPNGMNFRSIELVDLYQHNPQHLLNTCTHTLENLSIVFRGNSTYQFSLSFSHLVDHVGVADKCSSNRTHRFRGSRVHRVHGSPSVYHPPPVPQLTRLQPPRSLCGAFDHHLTCLLRARA